MTDVTFLTKTDSVAETLRTEIMRGDLLAGTPLQQEEVARRLGCSSTPVREAFLLLEAEGFVEKRAHHGVVVAKRDPSEIADVYELRAIVESLAFRRAVDHVDKALIAELDALNLQAQRALKVSDLHAYRRNNAQFHQLLVSASASPVYREAAGLLIARSLFAVPLDKAALLQMLSEHRAIVRCLAQNDQSRSVRLMDRHLRAMNVVLGHAMNSRGRARRAREDGRGAEDLGASLKKMFSVGSRRGAR